MRSRSRPAATTRASFARPARSRAGATTHRPARQRTPRSTRQPVEVKGITDAIGVGAGGTTTCVIQGRRTACVLATTLRGGLGDGTKADSKVPVASSASTTSRRSALVQSHLRRPHERRALVLGRRRRRTARHGDARRHDEADAAENAVGRGAGRDRVATTRARASRAAGPVLGPQHRWTGRLGRAEPGPTRRRFPSAGRRELHLGRQPSHLRGAKDGQDRVLGQRAFGQLGIGAVDAATNKKFAADRHRGPHHRARAVWTGGCARARSRPTTRRSAGVATSTVELGNGSADDKLVAHPGERLVNEGPALSLVALGGAARFLACNAIIGVEDVKLKSSDAQSPGQRTRQAAAAMTTTTTRTAAAARRGDRAPHDRARLQPRLRALARQHGPMLGRQRRRAGRRRRSVGPTREPVLRPKDVPGVTDAIAIASGLVAYVHRPQGQDDSVLGREHLRPARRRDDEPLVIPGRRDRDHERDRDRRRQQRHVRRPRGQDRRCAGATTAPATSATARRTASVAPVKVKNVTNASAVTAAAPITRARRRRRRGHVLGRQRRRTARDRQRQRPGTDAGPVKPRSTSSRSRAAASSRARQVQRPRLLLGRQRQGAARQRPTARRNRILHPCLVRRSRTRNRSGPGSITPARSARRGALSAGASRVRGSIGMGSVADPEATVAPTDAKGVTAARLVWTGGDRTCAVIADNKAYCLGANTLGQLGNGTTDRAFTAVVVKD